MGFWTGPLACLSLSSVMSWIRSDPSIWKPVFPNLVLPNKVACSRDRVKFLLDQRFKCKGENMYNRHKFYDISGSQWKHIYLACVGREGKESFERSAKQHRHLILLNGCSDSEYIFEFNIHCYYSMKDWKSDDMYIMSWNRETGNILTKNN